MSNKSSTIMESVAALFTPKSKKVASILPSTSNTRSKQYNKESSGESFEGEKELVDSVFTQQRIDKMKRLACGHQEALSASDIIDLRKMGVAVNKSLITDYSKYCSLNEQNGKESQTFLNWLNVKTSPSMMEAPSMFVLQCSQPGKAVNKVAIREFGPTGLHFNTPVVDKQDDEESKHCDEESKQCDEKILQVTKTGSEQHDTGEYSADKQLQLINEATTALMDKHAQVRKHESTISDLQKQLKNNVVEDEHVKIVNDAADALLKKHKEVSEHQSTISDLRKQLDNKTTGAKTNAKDLDGSFFKNDEHVQLINDAADALMQKDTQISRHLKEIRHLRTNVVEDEHVKIVNDAADALLKKHKEVSEHQSIISDLRKQLDNKTTGAKTDAKDLDGSFFKNDEHVQLINDAADALMQKDTQISRHLKEIRHLRTNAGNVNGPTLSEDTDNAELINKATDQILMYKKAQKEATEIMEHAANELESKRSEVNRHQNELKDITMHLKSTNVSPPIPQKNPRDNAGRVAAHVHMLCKELMKEREKNETLMAQSVCGTTTTGSDLTQDSLLKKSLKSLEQLNEENKLLKKSNKELQYDNEVYSKDANDMLKNLSMYEDTIHTLKSQNLQFQQDANREQYHKEAHQNNATTLAQRLGAALDFYTSGEDGSRNVAGYIKAAQDGCCCEEFEDHASRLEADGAMVFGSTDLLPETIEFAKPTKMNIFNAFALTDTSGNVINDIEVERMMDHENGTKRVRLLKPLMLGKNQVQSELRFENDHYAILLNSR